MMGLALSRRARLGLLAIFLIALVALFPMRLAFGIFGMDRYGLAARSVTGSIWWGRIGKLSLSDVSLGTVDAGLSPLSLLIGRARIGVSRKDGQADDIEGALTAGFGRIGIDDATGMLPLGAAAAPLPIASADLSDVSVRFSGGLCGAAEGQVRAHLSTQIPGLNLSQGLSGAARCEGPALLLPLVSQSGMEKITLRISPDGRYAAEMRVTTADPALQQALGNQGFAQSDDASVIKVEGIL
ncbi:type II secretion system protein N [Sphingobium phenoxybenzoativorans]|uniref:Type II secretion system protein N n=1 Tax=Sphingobium phenoxybenzoativorans TaxID=1592790 RepID=A0A975KAD2_9SPHN|nr:type II secretion system protein N [Sphingobium phenoxybenzoativorans]QUT07725.1 type II secretion system protein N [Sphingobium phenoxybenzoativorans]